MKVHIVDGPLPVGKASRPRYRTARVDGQEVKVRVVDADSPTFTADFTAAFRASVRRARKENAKLPLAAK